MGCASERQFVTQVSPWSLRWRKWCEAIQVVLAFVVIPVPALAVGTCGAGQGIFWTDSFERDFSAWGQKVPWWGQANAQFLPIDGSPSKILRVAIPAGTYDPGSMIKLKRPVGGLGFAVRMDGTPRECVFFRYFVRFPLDFDFVRGGKLPGLIGGYTKPGRKGIPRGLDGFTTRYMWLDKGRGEVYAYLRTTPKPGGQYYGVGLGTGRWSFVPGRWHHLEQQVIVNEVGRSNGVLRVWLDEKLVLERTNLEYRDAPEVLIDGIVFEIFFGGNDPSYAPGSDTYVDLTGFALSDSYIGLGQSAFRRTSSGVEMVEGLAR